MTSDDAVLRELRESDGWLYGLGIVERVEARTDLSWWRKFWTGRGNIYAILYRLENRGLVESRYEHLSPDVGGQPRRKVFRLV